jgi:hypothetical protein
MEIDDTKKVYTFVLLKKFERGVFFENLLAFVLA